MADTCKYCRAPILKPITAEGKKLPAIGAEPDPQGTVAAYKAVAGPWVGRFLKKAADAPADGEERYAVHHCDGLERQRQRGRWTSVQSQHARERRRRRAAPNPADVLPGMMRLPREEVTAHDP